MSDKLNNSHNHEQPAESAGHRIDLLRLSQPGQPEAPQSQASVFLDAVFYSAIKSPINGIAELFDNGAKKDGGKVFEAPVSAPEGSFTWHVQQLGSGVGGLVPCLLLMKAGSALVGRGSLARETAAAMLSGLAYGGVFTPAGEGSRLRNATTSALGFGLIHLSSVGSRELISGLNSRAQAPLSRLGTAVAGVPVGIIAANYNSLVHNGELASRAQQQSACYTFGLLGLAAGGAKRTVRENIETDEAGGLAKTDGLRASFDRTAPAGGGTGIRLSDFVADASGRLNKGLGGRLSLRAASSVDRETDGTIRNTSPESMDTGNVDPKHLFFRLGVGRPGSIDLKIPELDSFSPDDPASLTFRTEARPAKVYDNGGVELAVTKPYADILDQVRAYRAALRENPQADKLQLSKEILGENYSYADRALPEDFLPWIDSLPNRGIVRRVVLLDEANPEDAVQRLLTGNDHYCSSAVCSTDGEITFFQRSLNEFARPDLFHEWSHSLRYALRGSPDPHIRSIPDLFDSAADLEKEGYQKHDIGAIDPEENWSIHLGEDALAGSPEALVRLAESAPLRSYFLGRALRQSLEMAERDGTSGNSHQMWVDRASILENQLPRARDFLASMIRGNGQSADRAATLLAHIGAPEIMESMPVRTLDLSGSTTSDTSVLNASSIRALENINLSGAQISNEAASLLVRNSNLRAIDLSHTEISDTTIDAISRLPRLDTLNLSFTRITPRSVQYLRCLQSLRELNIRGTQVSQMADLEQMLPHVNIVR